jgi:acetyl esterase/lipase
MQRSRNILSFAFLCVLFAAQFPLAHAAEPNYLRKEVIYGRKYGTALTMDVFTPKADANGAGVIWTVSGGWFSDHNNIDGGIPQWVQPLVDKGFIVFAVVHGSNPKFTLPEIFNDMNRAVRFIRHNAADYGVDRDRIGITGGSAGGHLSLLQGCGGGDGNPKGDAVDRESSRVQAVVAFYPPTDFLNWGEKGKTMLGNHPIVPQVQGAFNFTRQNPKNQSFELITDEKEREEIARQMSPLYHAAKGNPPTLIIHGDHDALVPLQQAQIMRDALNGAGATVELIVKPGGQHDGALVKEFQPQSVAWFEKYLTKRAP